jgi:hypothetical protein
MIVVIPVYISIELEHIQYSIIQQSVGYKLQILQQAQDVQ